ncbi:MULTISPECIES: RHS repeat-associated core domain-containing protein, partial [Enterobacterales]|uniref:RHS repeat domain-containing protein n=1 Tax=Enterobacterales TaxID=91347 RepID=UPI002ED89F82
QKLVDKGGYRPQQWRYRWDAKNQLTGLETPEGERWEYKYDPFGRRISKRCTNRDKPGMDFHWNGDQLTEEIPVGVDGKQEYESAIRWIYEPGNFTPLARYEKGQLHYAVTDTVGRIQELLTEEGTIIWQGKQQLWGREEGINKDDVPTCRLRFPGQYEDAESGLHYNRFRYYDYETGQYISSDPIGLMGGVNLYGYVSNPLRWVDPLGLSGEPTGSENNPFKTSRAARRDAMRQAGIPTSQQPVSQSQNSSGREYSYETPKPGGGTGISSVQEQTMDSSHPDSPHWEAGQVKTDDFGNPRMNKYGRPQIRNGKGKAYYVKEGCKGCK